MKKLISLEGMSLKVVLFLLVSMTALSGCSKDQNEPANASNNTTGNTSGPGTNEVWIQGSAFTPQTITVTAGTKVTWTNKDGIAHTVTSNTGIFNSGNMNNNAVFSFTFATAGTYPYHCAIHPGMTGTVVVN
jgi:plastocyanin